MLLHCDNSKQNVHVVNARYFILKMSHVIKFMIMCLIDSGFVFIKGEVCSGEEV